MSRSRVSGVGCAPTTPALPPPGKDGSKVDDAACRERRDLDGNVDCEKGVVGDVRLADVLDAPLAVEGNAVVSCGGS